MKFIHPQEDHWHPVSGEDGPQVHPDNKGNCLLSLEQWHAVRDGWPANLAVALELSNTVDVLTLASDLSRIAMISLQFPKWVDGRAYTQARLLRQRLGFKGEIRAKGDVLVDMMQLLERTGFNAVHLRADQDQAAAKRALSFFSAYYQGDTQGRNPLFARTAV